MVKPAVKLCFLTCCLIVSRWLRVSLCCANIPVAVGSLVSLVFAPVGALNRQHQWCLTKLLWHQERLQDPLHITSAYQHGDVFKHLHMIHKLNSIGIHSVKTILPHRGPLQQKYCSVTFC